MKQENSKPWYRLRNVCLAFMFAIFLFFGWAFLEVWEVYTARANPSIDFRTKQRELAEKYSQVSTEESDESWELFIAALELSNNIQNQTRINLVNLGFTPRSELDFGDIDFIYVCHSTNLDHEIDRERSCLEQMQEQGVMKAIAALVDKTPGLSPPEGKGPMINEFNTTDTAYARTLALALAAQMRIATTENNFNQCVSSFKQILTIANTCWHQPGLIDRLVGIAMLDFATRELRLELEENEFDESVCEELLEILNSVEIPPITLAIESEKLFIQDTMQWTFTDDGNNNGYMIATEDIGILEPNNENRSLIEALASRFYFADRMTVDSMLDEFIHTVTSLTSMSLIDRRANEELDQLYELIESNNRVRFLAILLPAFNRFLDQHSINQLQTQGTRLMLAIELYQARHGKLPNSLDDLVPNILEKLPVDPIHGGSFKYKLLENDPRGREFLLYSTGLDQKDNGGDFSRDDSYEAVSYHPSGYDFLINQRRPGLEDF